MGTKHQCDPVASWSEEAPRWMLILRMLMRLRVFVIGGFFCLFAEAIFSLAAGVGQELTPLAAEKRAVDFLRREVFVWRGENGCFSCHNNGDAARGLYAAVARGYKIPPETLKETAAWLERPDAWDDNGDLEYSDPRLAAIQFGGALLAAGKAMGSVDQASLRRAAERLIPFQDSDGSWRLEPHNPVGSPATYATHLGTYLAWEILSQLPDPASAAARINAERWLGQANAPHLVAAASLLLASARIPEFGGAVDGGKKRAELLKLARDARSREGGWGPYPDSPPESFDTGLMLLGLAAWREEEGVEGMIEKGRRFLLIRQNADGSWPASTRPPGGDSYAQQLSTTGWALLGLLATRGP